MRGLIAKKLGMTQVFTPDGRAIPVTVLQAGPNVVVQKKSVNGKDGYAAVKLGFGDIKKLEKDGEEPRYRLNAPRVGVFQKAGIEAPRRFVAEFRLDESELERYEVGGEVNATEFTAGMFVDVTGTSKGRGFAGVMKRHNFHGAKEASHGTSEHFRHAGSIGASADPARVVRGKKMPGQFGNSRSTTQNLHIVEVIEDQNILLVKGGVPGPNGGIVTIRSAGKNRSTKPTGFEPEVAESE
jgi:large subunit ribosomal protein L3